MFRNPFARGEAAVSAIAGKFEKMVDDLDRASQDLAEELSANARTMDQLIVENSRLASAQASATVLANGLLKLLTG